MAYVRNFQDVDPLQTAAVPYCGSPAGGVNENAAHDLSANGVKVRFIFPVRFTDIDQFQVDLVDERGGLQRVLFALAPDEGSGHSAEFPVNPWGQRVKSGIVASDPIEKKLSRFRDIPLHGHLNIMIT